LLRSPAAPQTIAKERSWAEQQEINSSLASWQIRGKIGVRSQQKSGSANLFWQQQQEGFDIRLAGPLGRGAARLVGTAKKASLEAADNIAQGNAQKLLNERLGWELPLDELTWWLRGLPAPGKTAVLSLNTENRLWQLSQQGWQIDFQRYRSEQGYWLPERLKISGHNLLVTLVIKDWELAARAQPPELQEAMQKLKEPDVH